MADQAAACHALEQATLHLQSPNASVRTQAEKQLLQLKRLPVSELFSLVQVVMSKTVDVGARFHGVQTLRSACLEQWTGTNRQVFGSIRDWAVSSALQCRDEVVRSQLLCLCAILIKRMYLEIQSLEEKCAFFRGVREHAEREEAEGRGGFSSQVEQELLQNLVSEFSHETASKLGMPFAFHHACKERFESEFLVQFFELACAKGKGAYLRIKQQQSSSQTPVDDQLVLLAIASIESMVQILQSWDFRKKMPAQFFNQASSSAALGTTGALALKPGKEWRERLLSAERISWIYELNQDAHASSVMDSPLASTIRQLILIMASLHGNIFHPDSTAAGGVEIIDPLKLLHLRNIQLGIHAILHPCEQIVGLAHGMQSEQRLKDACTALACLCEHNKLGALTTAMQGDSSNTAGIGSMLSTVTLACIQCGGGRDDQIDLAVGTSLTALLEAWEHLIQTECIALGMRRSAVGNNNMQNVQAHEESGLKEGAAHVFRAYLESLLMEAAETALDDLDEEEEEQSLEMRQQKLGPLSSIARVSAEASFELLCQKLAESQVNIAQHAQDEINLARYFEQLCCILELSGYCLADPIEGGETPLMPILLSQCHDSLLGMNRPDPVVKLSNTLLELASKLALDQKFQQVYSSPRILESLMQCLTKWTATYLLSDDDQMPLKIRETYTLDANTYAQVINIIVRLLGNTFVQWMGETKVQEQVCKHLLPALVQGKRRRSCLMNAPAWNEFLAYYVHNFDTLALSVRGNLHRSLVKYTVKVASKPLDEQLIKQYLEGVMNPVLKRIAALGNTLSTGGSLMAQQMSMQLIEFLLEGLRGATQGFLGIGLSYLLEIFVNVQPLLLKLLSLQEKSPRMVYLVLKLTAEVIEALIAELNQSNFSGIMNFVYEILGVYKKQNIGEISLQKSKALKDEEAEEKYKNIRALLKLLSAISEKDMVDFGTADSSEHVDVATAIFIGIEMVVPLLSQEQLSFPKLAQQYFDLVGHMCEVYPEKVSYLPQGLFTTFVETLKFGVESNDFKNLGSSLDAVYHLVKFHLQDISRGKPGLGANLMQEKWSCSIITLFMKTIFHKLIYETYPSTLIEQSSSVLLVLMIADNKTFQEIGVSIINSQVQEDRRNALQNTLNQLASSMTVHSDLTRQSRRKFSREFESFVIDIRGIAKSV